MQTNRSRCRTSLSEDTTAIGKVLLPEGGDVPVNAFLGIPYARPPVGDLRFCPPQPLELWAGERDCTEFGAVGMQPLQIAKLMHDKMRYPDVTSEDCLYLNVYSPNLKPDARLPVMVWFFGGGYIAGGSDPYDGTALAGFYDVIVVTVNYRLGAFGFFTTGDDVIPGNNGLLDQVESLKWIQKHITSFGGNPDNVTIFGESAGGMACSLHVLCDVTVGLFHRVIIQSGPATSTFALTTSQKVLTAIKPKLEEMGYKGNSSEELAVFMRSRTAEELLKFDMVFRPVVDGHYLKDYPHNLYYEGKFQNLAMISGCCLHDGYVGVKYSIGSPDLPTEKTDLQFYTKRVIGYHYSENVDAILDAVYPRYITDEAIGNADKFRQQYVELVGDMMYYAPNHRMVMKHSGKAPVYVYIYAHRGSFVEDEPWLVANHFHDVYPTFGLAFTDALRGLAQSESDKKVSKIMMNYWTNFAKSGNPNGPNLAAWSQFSQENKVYMLLKENPEEVNDYQPERMEFWRKEIPKLDTGRVYKELS